MIPHIALIGKILLIAADIFFHTVMRKDEEPDLAKLDASLREWKRKQLAKRLRKDRHKLREVRKLKDTEL